MPKQRNEIPEEYKWNTAALYPTLEQWTQELKTVQGQEGRLRWPEIAAYQGRLSDPKALADLFKILFDLDRRLSKLYTYAHLNMDQDLGNDANKHNYGLITQLFHAFQLESSWIEPELLNLTEGQYKKLLKDPALKAYGFYLEKIYRRKAHTLSPEEEKLLALSGKALSSAHSAYSALSNADLTFKPAIDSEGKEHPLSLGSYYSFSRSEDRDLRKSAFRNLFQNFGDHINAISELLQGLVEGHLFIAKARKFPSCLDASLFDHKIDPEVYRQLIQTVRKGLPLMHEYVELRKKVLNLEKIHSYDLYVPLVPEEKVEMTYEEACQAVIASVAPLGHKYQEILRKGLLEDRWVDVYENARKRSGGYSSGCYDSMPYILLNYHGKLDDVLTLAHEAGHSMHSYLSRENQPYIYADYPLFVAEVASTFNEQLLLQYLLSKAKTKEEKAVLINHQIEGIKGTIFQQTLFAEFEWQLHEWAEKGVPLTPTLLGETYSKLLQEYNGPSFIVEPEGAFGWARIPHFYYNFYVYQYATGLSAALGLFEKAIHSKQAMENYLKFLSSGGSKYPLDLLKIAGIDMASPEPVELALKRFGELIQELKTCLED